MKIKSIFIVSVLAMLTLTACNTGTDEQSLEENKIREGTMQERNRIVDELDPAREDAENEELNNQLGYVNYTRDQMENEEEQNHEWNMDREQMADHITRTILRNDGFEEVATLVTDAEVLIVYSYDHEEFKEEEAADIVKKTADSAMPGFYDIYVSDNDVLINDIRSLHNSTTTSEHDPVIEQIIEEMDESND
jgi:hypothetical protein